MKKTSPLTPLQKERATVNQVWPPNEPRKSDYYIDQPIVLLILTGISLLFIGFIAGVLYCSKVIMQP